MSWYEIKDFSMDMLEKLGITDINKAYKEYFKDYADDFDEDEDFGEGEKTRSFSNIY